MKSIYNQQTGSLLLILCLLFGVVLTGCGGSTTKVVHGTVSCGGEKAADGSVCFTPVEGTTGPACSGIIADGEYRIEARGGVPVGKYRVEIRATKKTGRKTIATGRVPGERTMVDEIVPISPIQYEGRQSPLVVEVTSSGDGRIDIEIPGRK